MTTPSPMKPLREIRPLRSVRPVTTSLPATSKEHSGNGPVQTIDAYLMEIRELEAQPRPSSKQLIQLYRRMINDYPEAASEPYVGLAYFSHRANRSTDALLFLKQALKIEPFSRPIQQLYQKIKPAAQAAANR